ncbi:MAG: four helix bundle protein, partial [Gammaproteobacteria bacterium]
SGTFIGTNVEEGQAARSAADFISSYAIACKDARASYDRLRSLAASDIVPEERLIGLRHGCDELIAFLTTIIRTMREKKS